MHELSILVMIRSSCQVHVNAFAKEMLPGQTHLLSARKKVRLHIYPRLVLLSLSLSTNDSLIKMNVSSLTSAVQVLFIKLLSLTNSEIDVTNCFFLHLPLFFLFSFSLSSFILSPFHSFTPFFLLHFLTPPFHLILSSSSRTCFLSFPVQFHLTLHLLHRLLTLLSLLSCVRPCNECSSCTCKCTRHSERI